MNKQIPKLCENFLNYLSILNKSDNTIKAYRKDLELWAEHEKLEYNTTADYLECMTLSDFYNFIGSLKNKNDEKLSASTLTRIIATLKSFYSYMKKFGLIKSNPTLELERPELPKRLIKFLAEDEMIDLLRSINKIESRYPIRDLAILTLFLNTGIRKSELLDINTDDIKDDTLVVKGKGNKEREIPLTPSSIEAIKNYLRTRPDCDGKALFINKNGQRLGVSGVTHLVKKYLGVIGKEDLSTHKLRHSCFTNLLVNGTDIRTVQDLAGHSNIATTSIYLHVNNKAKKQAVMNTALANL